MTVQCINGKTYVIKHNGDVWTIYMDGKDIADFPTENTAKVWLNDRARNKVLGAKTESLINSF